MKHTVERFRERNGPLLVLPVVLIGCVLIIWSFARIADEVTDGDGSRFDEWALRLLRDPADLSSPLGPPWLQHAALELTTLGGTTVLAVVVLIGAGYLLLRRSYLAAAALVIAVVTGRIMSSLLKLGFARPRPDVVPHLSEVTTLSFPSGHAMMAAVVWLILGAMLAQAHAAMRLKIYFLALAAAMTIVIGLTRIYLGVHYPTDVLAGWAAGAAWASLWWAGVAWRQRRAARQSSAEPAAGRSG